ncbi:MAG: hypothetical protein GY828_08340 [Candidatus Gracilibacteria bacterium]|nr:hypothetical protein [Candidatus Gracilibacteria bacterium]
MNIISGQLKSFLKVSAKNLLEKENLRIIPDKKNTSSSFKMTNGVLYHKNGSRSTSHIAIIHSENTHELFDMESRAMKSWYARLEQDKDSLSCSLILDNLIIPEKELYAAGINAQEIFNHIAALKKDYFNE